MRLSKSIVKFQWSQLFILAFAHLCVDISAGILPAILPKIREVFGFSLTKAVLLFTILGMTCNGIQIIVGYMRKNKKTLFFIPFGIILSILICFLPFVQWAQHQFTWLAIIAFFSGLGIGVVHPEAMRAIHFLKRVPSAMGTAIFVNAGFLGYYGGTLLSAWLVFIFGLKGLLFLLIISAASLLLVFLSKARLAVENPSVIINKNTNTNNLSFWFLFATAIPVTIAVTVIAALLPTRLNELGFKLYFGGMPLMLFGLGGIFGSIAWAALSHRKGQMPCFVYSTFLTIPFLIGHVILIRQWYAVFLMIPIGFCSVGAQSLIVSMARHCKGASLGQRMGWIIGGAWGVGTIGLMLLSWVIAEPFGVKYLFNYTWIGYLITALMATYAWKKHPPHNAN